MIFSTNQNVTLNLTITLVPTFKSEGGEGGGRLGGFGVNYNRNDYNN